MACSKKRQAHKAANDVKSRWPLGVSLAVAAGIFVTTLLFVRPSGEEDAVAAVEPTGEERTVRSQPKAPSRPVSAKLTDCEEQPEAASEADVEDPESETVLTEEEKRNAEYERMFEALTERQKDEAWRPSSDDVAKFKRAFDGLTEEQKVEQIPHALNLLTDESFGLIRSVLMDPKEPQDVLESIYHDLLNRAEGLKYPVLREVYAVDGHPLRQEIEELDAMLE